MMDEHSAKKKKKHSEWSTSVLNRKTHWQEISCQHSPQTPKTQEEREETGWKEKEKLGILWTHRHALKQQVSCERTVGGSIYLCMCTLWAAVCQQSREGWGLYVRVIGGSCAPCLMWSSLFHLEKMYHKGALQHAECTAYRVKTGGDRGYQEKLNYF